MTNPVMPLERRKQKPLHKAQPLTILSATVPQTDKARQLLSNMVSSKMLTFAAFSVLATYFQRGVPELSLPLHSQEPVESYQNQTEDVKSLTVIVPGFGDMRRMQVMKESLLAIQTSLESQHYGFRCFVYVYKEDLLAEIDRSIPMCNVTFNKGLWTHHMKKLPEEEAKESTHVAVLMDDIDVKTNNVSAARMIDRMDSKGYQMVSAAVPGWSKPAMSPRSECRSHETGFIDVLFAIYERESWLCWQRSIDLGINSFGWGYDLTFSDLCNASVGVIDTDQAIHYEPPEFACKGGGGGGCTRSYNKGAAMNQMFSWINEVRKRRPDLSIPHPKGYKWGVENRWKRYARCDDKDEEVVSEPNKL